MIYALLIVAVIAEVGATICLRESDGFTKWLPSLGVVFGYGLAFYLLTIIIRVFPLGITYALWSGLGLLVLTLVSVLIYKEVMDWAAWLGIALIVAGVFVLRLFSKSVAI